jgi:hypothetical protein
MLTDHFLDTYVAHKLSALTECGAPELSLESQWLNRFIINSALYQQPADKRAFALNFIRRAEGAVLAYREAREALLEFIREPRNVISPYFRSLSNFEVCISYSWQACELIRKAIKQDLYVRGVESDLERLNSLYNDSKHLEERLAGGELPTKAAATVWMTNVGLESVRCPSGLSFSELVEILVYLGQLAGKTSRFEP